MIEISPQLQIIVVDILFMVLVVGIVMWFRSWLGVQTRKLDRRFEALDASLKQLNQVQERLQGVCRTLTVVDPRSRGSRSFLALVDDEPAVVDEGSTAPPAVATRASGRSAGAPRESSTGAQQHQTYERARQLLGKGLSTQEVARMVDLGVAEVEVLKRMGQLARSSSR